MKKLIYESDIESRLVKGIADLDGVCLKIGYDGWPDRLCVLPDGKFLWVELKRDDGELSALQKWRRAWLKNRGHRVEVPYSKEDVDEILKPLRTRKNPATR